MSVLQLHGPHEVKGRQTFVNPSGVDRIEKGDLVLVDDDNLLGVAITGCGIAGTAKSTEDGEPHGDTCVLATLGDFTATLGAAQSFTQGQPVYLDTTDGKAYEATAANRFRRATATEATTGASTTVEIRFHGSHDAPSVA